MLQYSTLIGRVVYSLTGRDAGKYFIIVSVLDDEYVYLSDGDLRKIENPKKKKTKHLRFTDVYADEIRQLMFSGAKISNSKVNKFLQSEDINQGG